MKAVLASLLLLVGACAEEPAYEGPASEPDAPIEDAAGVDPDVEGVDMGGGQDVFVEDEPEPRVCEQGSACGVSCVDLDTDPANCGFCGRTCVVPRASAACVSGQCAVGLCEAGFVDADGEVNNGCELENDCNEGEACALACGSEGLIACVGVEAICDAPAERCNAADDDCDGECDEGGIRGCRAGIHRASGNGHLYTNDLAAASNAPYNLESQNYFFVYAQPVPGTRPLFLCRKGNGKRFLTSDTACEMAGGQERQLGFWSPEPQCGSVPLYRLHQASSLNHFYTLNPGERDNAVNNLGYVSEGIAGYVWRAP